MISDFGFPIWDLNLARYIIRASFSQERMTYIKEESKVSYQSKDGTEEKVFDALEWLAAMCSHVPNKGEQMVRNDGYYSNASRGKPRSTEKNWASLIQNIYEPAEPLTCPKCQWKNSPVFSVEVPISCGTIYVLKNSVFCYHNPNCLRILSNTI